MKTFEIPLPCGQFGAPAATEMLLSMFPTAKPRGRVPGGWSIPGGTAIVTCRRVVVSMR